MRRWPATGFRVRVSQRLRWAQLAILLACALAGCTVASLKLLDSDRIVSITEHVVREAVTAGRCVIVGRGSQYFLRERPDAYHVFIYAPYEEKIRRERAAGRSAADAAQLVETVDLERAAFIKRYFARDWPNRPLYHLMLNSEMGHDRAVETIVGGIQTLEKP
jgi:cytidylate kinase